MPETWYVFDDGTLGDPAEIGHDKTGILRHKDGRAVAYGPHGPLSRGDVDAEAEREKAKPKPHAKPHVEPHHKAMKPEEHAGGYKTRETKSKED